MRGDGHRHEPRRQRRGLVRGRRRRRARPSPTRPSNESTNDVLDPAAEDYTGASPAADPAGGPTTCPTTRLRWPRTASAPTSTTSTPAAARRPTHLGVSRHYKAVVWYTGDDTVTREPGWGAGNASRLAMDELLESATYLNEGGKVLYTGQDAGHQYTPGARDAALRPDRRRTHAASTPPATDVVGASLLYGSPSSDLQNDVIEYWFGAFLTNHCAGFDDDGNNLDVIGIRHSARPGRRWRSTAATAPTTSSSTTPRSSRRAGSCRSGDLPAVRELGGGQVRPAGRAVRPAQRDEVRLLADRRPDVQALDPHGERPGRRREHVVLDLLQHGVRLGSPVRRGSYRGPGRLDDPAKT